MDYVLHLITMAALFGILALSLDILVGLVGLMSLASAVFFGIGAYSTGLLMQQGYSPLMAQLVGMLIAAFASMVIAFPAIRIKGIYFVIVTIAVQMVFTVLLQNWQGVTGGDAGIPGIKPYALFGYEFNRAEFAVLTVSLAILILIFLKRLVATPFGQLLLATRDDELGAASLGKNVARAKLTAVALSSAIAAGAGSFFAHYSAYIDPLSFDIGVSIFALLIVMFGGAGTLIGPLVAAVILCYLPELLKFLPLSPTTAAPARQLVYSLLLVLVVYFRPQGLFGSSHR